jgi:serine/threonine-protein kinase HipA
MKRTRVYYKKRLVGELLAQDGIHYFSYAPDWLKAPLPLSPYQLPANSGVSLHREGHFMTLPALCHDSLPDRFGMLVLKKKLSERGVHNPSPLQMLTCLGDRTMGALRYEPAEDTSDTADLVNLVKAARSARQLLHHEHGPELDPALLQAGGTAGGMMPKILASLSPDGDSIVTGSNQIAAGWEPWLIKLNTPEKKEAALIELEHAYFSMAREAGLTVPETRLIRDGNGLVHFAIKRFDRDPDDPNQRVHIQTYAALAGINYQDPASDYEDLLRLTKHLTRNHEETCEQFRRMLFNVLAYNRDDHAKNFSFHMDEKGEWTLTPAYDLLYTDNYLGGNWMTVRGKRNNLKLDDFLQLAELMGIRNSQFNEIRQQMDDALRQWSKFAKASGLGPGLTKVVESSIFSMLEGIR